ncbi:MAG: tetratricopeptide repeat protein [Planctomycetes bacterium]|nr:tetratricopeptide repeat protein [Planctomycetota bacterium]
MPSTLRPLLLLSLSVALSLGALGAQSPAPTVETGGRPAGSAWLQRGAALLDIEDPVEAWRVFQQAPAGDIERVDRDLGLGRAHLMLGHADHATAYGEHAVAAAPGRQDAMALLVRALIRSRQFDEAVRRSRRFVDRATEPTADLLAARGSALFRVQRTSDAARAYRSVVALDLDHAEAHLRLGSGLLDPVVVEIPVELRLAVGAIAAGERQRAIELLQRLLRQQAGHPIVHRLLGETLYAERTARSMAMQDRAFRELAERMPRPDTRRIRVAEFVPSYRGLARARREVIERTAALFRSRLDKLVAVGGRHDLLAELERTTDADARKNLRGRRTFDGRVWDDVRGIGGLRAATGIEALDDAATFGFDTFAHEVAHQVHFFTFSPLERARIRSLYKQAMAKRCCLDYYAASNEAEYFGQGVEAFVSLAKRPGSETTHGHTRWELQRVDRALYDFIGALVDFDPLADPSSRQQLLALSARVALRCGRPEDALVAAEMMNPGAERQRLLGEIEVARRTLRSH